jgi:hypothetical protein
MRKLLVLAPLMAVWAVLLLALSQTPSVSVPEAEAGPYLTFAHCRGALVGQYGSDNDVAYEMRRLNAVRWSFGGAARIDHLTIAQALWFRRQVACGMSRDVYETYRDPAPSVPDAVADALNAAIPDGYDHLVHSKHVHGFMAYNDAVTTKEAVLELFDRAIAAEAVKVTSDPAHVHQVAA